MFITKRNRRTRKHLEHKKNKFNYNNFISEYYIDEDGYAYISVKVDDIYDIISKRSIKYYEWINQDFSDYIENVATYIPDDEDIILEICNHKFTIQEQELITKVIKQYFGLRLGDILIDINKNNYKSFFLLVFGIISIIILFLLSLTNIITTLSEIFVFGVWFFLWEYLDMRFLEGSNLNEKKLEIKKLADIKVIFNEFEK